MSIIPSESGRALLLNLTLQTDNLTPEQKQLLEHHTDSPNGIIARQILVPDMMRLHSLHYAIQAAFGWLNEHPHRFVLPQEPFDRMTNGKFAEWQDLAGIYFRVPGTPADSFYTNEQPPRNQTFEVWLRNRYNGPYEWDIGSFFEHLVTARLLLADILDVEIEDKLEERKAAGSGEDEQGEEGLYDDPYMMGESAHPGIQDISPHYFPYDFADIADPYAGAAQDPQPSYMQDALQSEKPASVGPPPKTHVPAWSSLSIDDAREIISGSMRDLIERLRIGQILCPPEAPLVSQRQMDRMAGKAEIAFAVGQHMTYPLTVEISDHVQDYESGSMPLDVLQLQDTYERVLSETDLATVPAASSLDYYYDNEAGWHIKIECTEVYTLDGYEPGTIASRLHTVVDHTGAEAMEDAQDIITDVVLENRPLCTAVLGPRVMDNIGGLAGFAEFLGRYHSSERDVRTRAVRQARQQSWSPDTPSPESVL